jgi:hypothetical protein
LSPGGHFLDAAAWPWGNAWAFAAGRALWGLSIALLGVVVSGGLTRRTGGNTKSLWPYIKNGVIGAVLPPIIVVGAVFLYNFVILYPFDQEDRLNERIVALENRLTAVDKAHPVVPG